MTSVGARRACRRLLLAAVPGIGLVSAAFPALAFFHAVPDIDGGRAIYAARCAVCHGANLEGQPDWQTRNQDGSYPAPPHDETGHTWHHGDAMLRDYIWRGGQLVLDDMGVDLPSGMPAFGGDLSEDAIQAVLDYIKSTWPEEIRAAQADRTQAEAATP